MFVGKGVKRFEDERFLVGRGRFVDDLPQSDALWAAFLRSPHAHAAVRSIDASGSLALPGVRAVLTGADWQADGLGDLGSIWSVTSADGTPMREVARPVFAVDRVRHVGDTVAMVIADTASRALDGAEALDVAFEPLDAVASADAALEVGARPIHDIAPNNLAFDWHTGDATLVAKAMAAAARVIALSLVIPRVTHVPVEPRAVLGRYDAIDGGYTLWSTTQVPHLIRKLLAQHSLRVHEHRLRVVAPDVGGGFGQKAYHYPEEAAVLWASRRLGRPIRWTATRSETFMVDAHARAHRTRAKIGLDGAGRITAIEADIVADLGAYLSTFGAAIPTAFCASMLSGLYRVPALFARVRGVYTNSTPVDAMRGAGRGECAYVVERLVDAAAHALHEDPVAFRARNFISKDAFPYASPLGPIYDSGDYGAMLDRVLGLVGYEALRLRQAEARRAGVLMGIGLSTFIESAGAGPSRLGARLGARIGTWEAAGVRVHADGKVTIVSGSHSHGQGHATVFRQVVADALGCRMEDIEVVAGDTAIVHAGGGTYGSRSATMAGSALALASRKIVEKAKVLAAHLLECAKEDLEFRSGWFAIAGTDRRIALVDVADAAYRGHDYPEGLELGLEETAYFDPVEMNYPSGAHVCAVIVDRDTGQVRITDYAAVDDVGRVLNPMIVEGQVHGGVVQGIGQALSEQVVYDPGTGQLTVGSLLDYAVPRAGDVPSFAVAFQETPSPRNPLGVKGAGESGTIGAPAAVVNAVLDALRPLGVGDLDMPLTPYRIWSTIRAVTRV
ncbi:MAG: xanthine dehydrogenase family protein molybdopterin-binding subunit [Alphaproteobacteria bacterium]|nr:xanthine dehydrogenase family protein molybdopterin-binding subunit [Alphaproteobacteria bacterium]